MQKHFYMKQEKKQIASETQAINIFVHCIFIS